MKTLGLSMEYEEYNKQLIFDGYIKEDGEPIKCLYCDSTNLHFNYKSHIQGVATECKVKCNECGNDVGYYYCGIWEI